MRENIDKRRVSATFRDRLSEAMQRAGSNQTDLARRTGVDRSTISQLLKDRGARLPNAHLIGTAARALGVSSDWLLGLSEAPESAQALMDRAITLTEAQRALLDDTIFDWHREAAGYKIRHVPAMLPDMLKTRAVLEWEYAPQLGRTAEQAISASSERRDWMRSTRSDYEIAMPLYELDSFARGTGYYAGLPRAARAEQMERLQAEIDTLYPKLRITLFDARRLYSAPVTIFGPLLAAIYVGRHYLAFRDSRRVDAMTEHFDHLVRNASVTSRNVSDHLRDLQEAM